MSQENVEFVKRAADAYEAGDLSAVLESFSPDLVTYVAPPLPIAGTYHGPEGFLQMTFDWAEAFDELVITPEEHLDAGDKVVSRVRHRASGAESGVPVETEAWYVWTIRAGRTVRAEIFNDKSEALEAAGLSE
jgi:ketosteroid isomerase-like protein